MYQLNLWTENVGKMEYGPKEYLDPELMRELEEIAIEEQEAFDKFEEEAGL